MVIRVFEEMIPISTPNPAIIKIVRTRNRMKPNQFTGRGAWNNGAVTVIMMEAIIVWSAEDNAGTRITESVGTPFMR